MQDTDLADTPEVMETQRSGGQRDENTRCWRSSDKLRRGVAHRPRPARKSLRLVQMSEHSSGVLNLECLISTATLSLVRAASPRVAVLAAAAADGPCPPDRFAPAGETAQSATDCRHSH